MAPRLGFDGPVVDGPPADYGRSQGGRALLAAREARRQEVEDLRTGASAASSPSGGLGTGLGAVAVPYY